MECDYFVKNTGYIGRATDVTVYGSYVVNGTPYNTVLAPGMIDGNANGLFQGCSDITKITICEDVELPANLFNMFRGPDVRRLFQG